MQFSDSDTRFMSRALELAETAQEQGEVPIGAVVVIDESIIGSGFNQPVSLHDPTAHAEIQALRQAAKATGNYRLPGATLYVTLEPCIMCAGAIVHARIDRLVFAARDLRFGGVRSKFSLADSPLLNHKVRIEEGLLAVGTTELLQKFFQQRRAM